MMSTSARSSRGDVKTLSLDADSIVQRLEAFKETGQCPPEEERHLRRRLKKQGLDKRPVVALCKVCYQASFKGRPSMDYHVRRHHEMDYSKEDIVERQFDVSSLVSLANRFRILERIKNYKSARTLSDQDQIIMKSRLGLSVSNEAELPIVKFCCLACFYVAEQRGVVAHHVRTSHIEIMKSLNEDRTCTMIIAHDMVNPFASDMANTTEDKVVKDPSFETIFEKFNTACITLGCPIPFPTPTDEMSQSTFRKRYRRLVREGLLPSVGFLSDEAGIQAIQVLKQIIAVSQRSFGST
uniref:Uncharacterized protein n=1 Tax=Spongospora subterranea TaxID=70186 RepID=A0A0H5QZ18_9EUKA|eukprot:CRZ07185.1 hypothetical protein [Spongospora subterranea]